MFPMNAHRIPASFALILFLFSATLLFSHMAQVGAASGGDAAFAQGKSAFAAGDKAGALTLFQKAADAGHPEAQYQLGVMYLKGWGVSKDAEKAYLWLGKAQKNGHAQATPARATLNSQLDASVRQRIDASL
jgi:TPR repeat protein